jgi:tripartite-type tricarboxylate transporter receptor subunit TctC
MGMAHSLLDAGAQFGRNGTTSEMRRQLAAFLSRVILLFLVFVSLSAAELLSGVAQAQDWPARPVKIVVPYGPGGISDVLARMTADRLSEMLGQRFIVETHPGANGAIGTEYAVRSTPDGYTLYHAGGAEFSVVPLMQKLSYDPLKELTPISMTAINGMALAINRDLPIHSVQEFIDYARANPGKINYGSVGHGSSSDLTPAAFAARAGLTLVDVPYTATPPSILAVVSGQIQMFFGNVSDIVGPARAGEVRLLAVSTAKRLPEFPDVPTVSETVPGFVMTGWNGYFAPAGTPRPIIDKVSKAMQEICRDPQFAQKMANLSLQAAGSTPEELAAAIQRDLPVYREAAEAAGIVQK